MKIIMIIDKTTDKLESTYLIKDEKVNKEVIELKKLYDDVNIDIEGNVVAWR